jgi:hypothetical protein
MSSRFGGIANRNGSIPIGYWTLPLVLCHPSPSKRCGELDVEFPASVKYCRAICPAEKKLAKNLNSKDRNADCVKGFYPALR